MAPSHVMFLVIGCLRIQCRLPLALVVLYSPLNALLGTMFEICQRLRVRSRQRRLGEWVVTASNQPSVFDFHFFDHENLINPAAPSHAAWCIKTAIEFSLWNWA